MPIDQEAKLDHLLKKAETENTGGVTLGPGRESGPTALLNLINRRKRDTSELEAFLNALPRKLSEDADMALWHMIMNQR